MHEVNPNVLLTPTMAAQAPNRTKPLCRATLSPNAATRVYPQT